MKKRELILKKLVLSALVGVLLLSGCGKSAGETSEAEKQEETTQENQMETEGAEAAETESEAQTTLSVPPAVTVDVCRAGAYAEDGTQLVSGSYEAPGLTAAAANEAYGNLRTALEDWTAAQDELFWQTMDQYEIYAQDHLDMAGAEAFSAYSTDTRVEYTRADASVVSFRQMYWDYTGGAHGNYGYSGVTFDAASGERLTLEALMLDKASMELFRTKAADYCVTNVKEQNLEGLGEEYAELIREEFSPGQEPDWYLDAAGITIVYNPYEIGPYSMGAVFVTIPYGEIGELMKPQYQGLQGAGVAELIPGVEAWFPLSGQEETVPAVLTLQYSEEDEYLPPSLSITAGSLTAEVEMLERIGSAYAVRRTDGKVFLLFDMDLASDDYVTLMYELSPTELGKMAELGASIDPGNVGVDFLKLNQRIDVLGTYSVAADYRIEADGSLTLESDWYEIVNDAYWSTITAVREIPVVIDGEETLLPAGSRLQLLGTDNEGIIRFCELDSGVEGEIHFTRNDQGWPIYIDGVAEDEYFENLPYAG